MYDAQIKIFPRLESDTVDVYVIVQDVWSITPGAGFSPGAAPATDINIRDVNFFGLGQDFYNTVKLKKTLPEKYNFTSVYTINNLYRTQSLAQLFYRFENGETRYGVGINREFISSAIKFAGVLNYTSYNNDKYVLQYNILNPDSISTPLRYNYQDVWIGYANRPSKKSDFGSDRFVIGARVQRTQYTNRPITRLKNQFLNNNFYLFNLGYVERTFFKDNYIFRLGRTEDIPEGTLVVLTTGYQYGENLRRPYYGILSTWSRYVKKAGYFYASAGIGAFRSNKFWEEGSYYAKGLYYTPLIRLGTWKLRNFISVRGTHAIKQQPGVFTDVNSDNGLRALNSILLKGTDKLAINIENDFFPDFNFIGFRMGFIIFTDLAWIGNQEKLFDKSNFFQGYGIGLRIRNENLVFSMFQFLFGIYPGAERLDQNNLHFFDRTKYFYNYDDLGISRPSVIPLN